MLQISRLTVFARKRGLPLPQRANARGEDGQVRQEQSDCRPPAPVEAAERAGGTIGIMSA